MVASLAPLLVGVGLGAGCAVAPDPVREEIVSPALPSYAWIDEQLEGCALLPLGATWRYFPGREEPSPVLKDLEWTKPEFDDSAWSEGPSGIGYGDGEYATRLDTLAEEGVTTLYLRHVLDVPDPGAYSTIMLEIPSDDGYVFYVNGKEEDRLHAWDLETTNAFDAQASAPRGLDVRPMPDAELHNVLKAGENTLAIQVIDYGDEPAGLGVLPVVRATYRIDPQAERARHAELRSSIIGPGAEGRLAYLDGRHAQRLDRLEEAVPCFLRAAELDPEAVEPWTRLVECHRGLGRLGALEAVLRERIVSGRVTRALADAWARLVLEDLGLEPTDLLGIESSELPETGFFADARWAGRELSAGRALLIDCGASEDREGDGATWSRDRFFRCGSVVEDGEAAPGIDREVRICERTLDDAPPIYRIPLSPGAYEVRLHVAAGADWPAGEAAFDVVAEDARVVMNHDPVGEGSELRFPARITDGFLELDLLPRVAYYARLSAIEVHPLSADRFEELTARWIEGTGRAFPLAQHAEALAWSRRTRAAFEVLERASTLPGFRPQDAERLAELQEELLPDVPTLAAVDRLLERRPGEGPRILAALREFARGDDAARARALYLEGRIHQIAGRFDDALAPFEELVASGTRAPEPHLRMAECLRDAELFEDANAFARDALFGGVPATPELLHLWFTLELDDLKRDPWELVAELRELDVPDVLVAVPTSEHAARPWQYTEYQPPSTTWSRSSFEAVTWNEGLGGIGCGFVPDGPMRSLWNKQILYARSPFTLTSRRLLYPHVRAYADDAADIYLNGTRVFRINNRTGGWDTLPVREDKFDRGLNILGIYGYNGRGPGFMDAGFVEPLGDLVWVLDELEEDGAIRIDCGGDGLVAADGTEWSADRFYGNALLRTADEEEGAPGIEGTDDDGLYLTERLYNLPEKGIEGYQIPIPDGAYRVTIHMVETNPDAQPGDHVFDVRVENVVVLEAHDVLATAGFATADVHVFDAVVTDGWLDVEFAEKEGYPTIAALAIERAE